MVIWGYDKSKGKLPIFMMVAYFYEQFPIKPLEGGGIRELGN
jgi:hypothetical protein